MYHKASLDWISIAMRRYQMSRVAYRKFSTLHDWMANNENTTSVVIF